MNNNINSLNAQNFDNWTNSEANYKKLENGEEIEDFKMFDFNASSYSSDIKDFAQEYINLYDNNGDGVWNREEFINMALGGQDIPDEYKEQISQFLGERFDALNLDNNKDSIDAKEFATELFLSDLDLKKFAETDGSLVDSLDGKVDYLQYNLNADPDYVDYDYIQELKSAIYNNFYAES
ncbi:hypothetical protein IJ182_02450 [bacterium]|nr:hypothetical protein [bacterium]